MPVFVPFKFSNAFNRQKEAYLAVLELQADLHAGQAEVLTSLGDAREQVEEAVAKGSLASEQETEIHALLSRAGQQSATLETRVAAVDRLRLTMLRNIVVEIGVMLGQLQVWRSNILLGEAGLETSFDPVIAGVLARYESVYAPIFKGGIIPDATNWGPEQWAAIAQQLDGPLFLWTPGECKENWKIAGVPDCDGPDYMTTLSLIPMVEAAEENQLDIMQEFTALASLDLMFTGGALEEYGGAVEVAQHAYDAATETLENIWEILEAVAKVAAKAAGALAGLPGILLLGGAAWWFFFRKKK